MSHYSSLMAMRLSTALVFILCGGCATLLVDVDVYKGPLANHEDVQTEQMAVMAIGAEPLLIELRDYLEWGENSLDQRQFYDVRPMWWQNGYVAPRRVEGPIRERFTNSQARRVNEILSLYEDTPCFPHPELVIQLSQALVNYRTSLTRFRPDDLSERINWWNRHKPRVQVGAAASEVGYQRSAIPQKFGEQLNKLRDRYTAYFTDAYVPQKNVICSTDAVAETIRGLQSDVAVDLLGITSADRWQAAKVRSNVSFEYLAAPELPSIHARLLYPDSPTEQHGFIERVREIAQAYLDVRASQEEVFVLALRLLVVLPEYKVPTRVPIDDPSCDELTQEFGLEVERQLIWTASALIQPIHLYQAVNALRPQSAFCVLGRKEGETDVVYFEQQRHLLENKLLEDPPQRALELLELHEAAKQQPQVTIQWILTHDPDAVGKSQEQVETEQTDRWRYGLVRGPSDVALETEQEVVSRGLDTVNKLTPLSRGRLALGIKTMVEQYLVASYAADQGQMTTKRERLQKLLVAFAEKMLFIANRDVLLDTGSNRSADPELSRYSLMVQNIGNSILIQANELIYRQHHDLRIQEEFGRESLALNQAFASAQDQEAARESAALPEDLRRKRIAELQTLIAEMEEEHVKAIKDQGADSDAAKYASAAVEAARHHLHVVTQVSAYPLPHDPPTNVGTRADSAKDVIDDAIAAMRQQHIKAVRDTGPSSPVALQLEAAITLAYRYRSNMVYIRPASAYLRSSYASTTLQQDPRLAWRNLLGRHALRNLPLLGEQIENQGERHTARIIRDIDKQYWQNINSVRVSGAGRTNYVVAKDDIGNWYVKEYSADPQDIIKGAQSLAMFGLGGELGVDMLSRLKASQGGAAEVPSVDPDTARTVLDRIFQESDNEFNTATNLQVEELHALLKNTAPADKPFANSLTARVGLAWSGLANLTDSDRVALAKLLASSTTPLLEATAGLDKSRVKEDQALDLVKRIAERVDSTNSASVLPALSRITNNLANPSETHRLLAFIAQKMAPGAGSNFEQTIASLRSSLGEADQSAAIIDALHAVRRFHNLLLSGLAAVTIEGTTPRGHRRSREGNPAAGG